MGTIGKFTSDQLAAYQQAAVKYRKQLLAIPHLGLEEILPYVTVRYGIRYKESVGTLSINAQFQPYKVDIKTGKDVKINFRTLETFMGAIDYEFEPNSAAKQVIGQNAATKGEAMKNADIVKKTLIEIAKQLSEKLNDVLWSAVRNDNGTTTAELFNGWDTITSTEITAGNIAAGKGNYQKLTSAITAVNAVDLLKAAWRKCDKHLKKAKTIMFVDPEILEAYEDAYSLLHNSTPWVQGFNQKFIEGSSNRCEIVPLSSKAGSKYIHITTKDNMLIGVDQMSDEEDVKIEHFAAFTLEFVATMFFGVEFESIDPYRLMVVELADSEEGSGSGSGAE